MAAWTLVSVPAGAAAPDTSPPPDPSATLHVSESGSDSAPCSDDAPCRSLTRAYRAAEPGQTVELEEGTYQDATIGADASKPSAGDEVRIVAAAGATVALAGQVEVSAQNVELAGLALADTLSIGATARNVTVRDSTMPNFKIFSSGSQAPTNISIIGGSIGPSADDNNLIASDGTSTTASPTNVLLDGVTIHDFTLSPGSSAHVECLQVWAVQGLTIRNSVFRNCEVFDIFLQKLPGGAAATPTGILIENNFLDCCRSGYFSIRLADHAGTSWQNVTIRNNSTNKAINADPKVPYANVQIVGNVAPQVDTGGALPAGIRADYNVMSGGARKGPHDVVAPAGFVSGGALDFHLLPTAAAVDRGDPASFPATDIDGQARPAGGAPDAGADERSDAGAAGQPAPSGAPGAGQVRTLRFRPVADAALRRGAPRRRGGSVRRLVVSRSREALLKFRVAGVGSGRVLRARLRLWVAKGRTRTLTVRRTAAGWKESRASWSTAPEGRGRVAVLRRLKPRRYTAGTVTRAVIGRRGAQPPARLAGAPGRAARVTRRRPPRPAARAHGRGVVSVRRIRLLAVMAIATAGASLAAAPAAPAAVRHVAPDGTDAANSCAVAAQPCASLDAAYEAAAAGETVAVAEGRYAAQTIAPDADKAAGAPVVLAAAPGAEVAVAGPLTISTSNVTVKGVSATDVTVRPLDVANPPPVSNVVLQDVDGRNFNIFSATDVKVLGGDWGPATACGGAYGGSNNSIRKLTDVNPANILIDGATIHDVQSYDLNACHIEGLAIFAGQNVTVRRSRFYGNSIYNVFLQANSGPISGVTLENNWFAEPVGTNGQRNGSAVGFSALTAGFTVRNNSFNGVLSLDDNGLNPAFSNVVVSGNIGELPGGACNLRGIAWSYNVWRGSKCAATDVNLAGAALPYVSRAMTAALDYHLAGGPAVDLLPASAPAPGR